MNDREAGALGCYPLRRERKTYGGWASCRRSWLDRRRERTNEGRAFDRENASVDLLSHPRSLLLPLSFSLCLSPSLFRSLSFIVLTEEDQYEPRGVAATPRREPHQPNPRACNNLQPEPDQHQQKPDAGTTTFHGPTSRADIFPAADFPTMKFRYVFRTRRSCQPRGRTNRTSTIPSEI